MLLMSLVRIWPATMSSPCARETSPAMVCSQDPADASSQDPADVNSEVLAGRSLQHVHLMGEPSPSLRSETHRSGRAGQILACIPSQSLVMFNFADMEGQC